MRLDFPFIISPFFEPLSRIFCPAKPKGTNPPSRQTLFVLTRKEAHGKKIVSRERNPSKWKARNSGEIQVSGAEEIGAKEREGRSPGAIISARLGGIDRD